MKKEKVQTKKKVSNKEKRKPNKLIIILTIILIIVIIVAMVVRITIKPNENTNNNISSNEEKVIINTNKGVTKEYEEDGIKFNNTSLISQDGESYLTVEVTNTNSTDYQLNEFHITLKDKDGNNVVSYIDENNQEINYLVGYVGETIASGETKQVVTIIDSIISDEAYTIEYEIIK
jgi:cytoskeletal protein RodZ